MKRIAVILGLGLGLGGCEIRLPARQDAGGPDAGQRDASQYVDGSGDAAPADAAPPDAAPVDSGLDAGPDSGITCPPTGPKDCSPGSGTGNANQCFDGDSCYVDEVLGAINGCINNHPDWFDTDNPYGCHVILDVGAFMDDVVSRVANTGLCVIRDPNAPNEEVTVKHNNAYSENFDIVASTGCARRSSGIYTGYCTPAWW